MINAKAGVVWLSKYFPRHCQRSRLAAAASSFVNPACPRGDGALLRATVGELESRKWLFMLWHAPLNGFFPSIPWRNKAERIESNTVRVCVIGAFGVQTTTPPRPTEPKALS